MSEADDSLQPRFLRVMQIIAAALIAAILVFLGIVLYLVQVEHQGNGLAPAANPPFVSYVACGVCAMMVPLSFVLPQIVIRNGVQRIAGGAWQPAPGGPAPTTDAGKLLIVQQTALIIGMAQLEGAGFLGCIAYLMEGQIHGLVVVAVCLPLMLLRFPTEGRVRSSLAEQLDQVDQMRQRL